MIGRQVRSSQLAEAAQPRVTETDGVWTADTIGVSQAARPLLERRIVELGIGDRVHLGGFVPVDRLAERLRAAHVGVVANRADPFTDLVVPTKLLEYVAMGLPAVVARTAAIESHFDDRALAWFRPGDARDLARALEGRETI